MASLATAINPRLPTSVRRAALALLAAFLLAPVQTAAQEKAAEAPAEATAPAEESAEPQAIPAAAVAKRAQDSRTNLNELASRSEPTPEVQALSENLAAAEKQVTELAKQALERIEQQPSPAILSNTLTEWEARGEELATQRKSLAKRVQTLADDLATLVGLKKQWEETQSKSEENGLPEAVMKTIADTLASIETTHARVKKRHGEILTLQTKIVALESSGADVLAHVDAAQQKLRDELFAKDSPALWEQAAEPRERRTVIERIQTEWTEDLSTTRTYLESNADRIVVYFVLLAAALVTIVLLRPQAARWAEEDESAGPIVEILNRPISAALLVSILGLLLMFRTAPPIFLGVCGLTLILPVARLAPAFLHKELRTGAYWILAWYAVGWFRDFLSPDPVATRFILLGEALSVSLLLLWLLRPARLSRLTEVTPWLRAIGLGTRIAMLLMLASLVANVVGNVSLAHMLAGSTLSSVYVGFLLFASSRVLENMWAVALRTRTARSLRMIRNYTPLMRARGTRVIRIALVVLWIYSVSLSFEIGDEIAGAFRWLLNASWPFGEIALSLGDVVSFGLLVYLTVLFSRLVRFVLEEDVMPRTALPRGVPFAISTIVRYVILVIGFMLAVASVGIDMTRFALLAGALGVGVGIGLQDIVNNFVSGLILLFERPIQTGDTVEVGGLRGEVRRIGIRSSTIRTWEGAEVIIPNARFISDQFVNWTLSDRQRRMEIAVGVRYGTNPEAVLQILIDVATNHESILTDPAPTAIFVGFGESSLDFKLRAWTADMDNWVLISSDLGVLIIARLAEAGITIPFPQRDLHLRSVAGAAHGGEEPLPPEQPEAEPSATTRSSRQQAVVEPRRQKPR